MSLNTAMESAKAFAMAMAEKDLRITNLTIENAEYRRAIMGAEPMPDLRHGQFLEMAAELHQHQRGHENSIRVIGRLLRLCDDNGLGDKAHELMEGIENG